MGSGAWARQARPAGRRHINQIEPAAHAHRGMVEAYRGHAACRRLPPTRAAAPDAAPGAAFRCVHGDDDVGIWNAATSAPFLPITRQRAAAASTSSRPLRKNRRILSVCPRVFVVLIWFGGREMCVFICKM